jgi:hypothetical protein
MADDETSASILDPALDLASFIPGTPGKAATGLKLLKNLIVPAATIIADLQAAATGAPTADAVVEIVLVVCADGTKAVGVYNSPGPYYYDHTGGLSGRPAAGASDSSKWGHSTTRVYGSWVHSNPGGESDVIDTVAFQRFGQEE